MLELIEEPPAVIFVTAFDEYALKAFELHAVDYLLKPFSRERFNKAVNNFLEQSKPEPATVLLTGTSMSVEQRQRIVVKNAGKIKIIPVEEIHYLEAADDYVKIFIKEGGFLKNRSMSHYESVLNEQQFVRTHRSFLVNVQQITHIEPYEKENYLAILKDGKQIPVSKNGYSKLKKVLGL